MSEAPTGRGVAAWLGARLALATVLLGGVIFAGTGAGGAEVPETALTALIVVTYALSLASGILLFRAPPGSRRERVGVLAQPVIDLAIVTGLVVYTGGASSGFGFLYGLSTLAAAIVIDVRVSRNVAIWAVLLYVTTSVSLSNGWLPLPSETDSARTSLRNADVGFSFLRNIIGLALVGALAGILADRLRRTGGELARVVETAALATQRADAAERLAALGRVAAGLAHEIRNPLSSISGSVQLVRDAEELGDEDRRLLGIVVAEVGRLEELVGTMLELGKARALEKHDTDLAPLVRDVVKMVEAGPAASAGVQISVDAEGSVVASVDADRVRQVIWNLLKNAVQASPASGVVRIKIAKSEGRAVLEVSDEGAGIPDDRKELIFDVFVTGRAQGTGLGLALVRQIVDAHGADIAVESEKGRGATFRVTF